MSAVVETTPSVGASGRASGGSTESGGAAGAAVEREQLLGRINELQEGTNAGTTIEKQVAKEMKRLEKKIDDMAPDKAIKHLMGQLRESLVREREVTAAAATAKSELSKVCLNTNQYNFKFFTQLSKFRPGTTPTRSKLPHLQKKESQRNVLVRIPSFCRSFLLHTHTSTNVL